MTQDPSKDATPEAFATPTMAYWRAIGHDPAWRQRARNGMVVALGGLTCGTFLPWFKWTGGLRDYLGWGGDPIGGITTDIAYFGETREMTCSPPVCGWDRAKALTRGWRE